MLNPLLTDPAITVYPLPELPPDDVLRQFRVSVSYAQNVPLHMHANPYDDLELQLTGDVVTVANWIDEHIEIFDSVMGGEPYEPGRYREGIIRALLKGGIRQFGGVAFEVQKLTNQPR